jgi:hypothetical protein
VSIPELYKAVEDFLYSQPKADGVSLIWRLDATRRDKNRIEAALTLLTQEGTQDAKTHARALFGDASPYTVHQYTLPLYEMTFEAAQRQDHGDAAEEQPEPEVEEEEEPEVEEDLSEPEAEPDDDTPEYYEDWSHAQLREELGVRGLSKAGTKTALIERLERDDTSD